MALPMRRWRSCLCLDRFGCWSAPAAGFTPNREWIGSWGIVTLSALAAAGMFRAVNGYEILQPSGSATRFAAAHPAAATGACSSASARPRSRAFLNAGCWPP